MGLGVRDVLEFFIPPDPNFTEIFGKDADPVVIEGHMKSLRWWRMKVSLTLGLFALTAMILGTAALTGNGLALAGDVDIKVGASVKQAVQELKTEQIQTKVDVAAIKKQNEQMSESLNQILRSTIAVNICRSINRIAREPDKNERAAFRRDADEEQENYRRVTGEYYPESRCGGS